MFFKTTTFFILLSTFSLNGHASFWTGEIKFSSVRVTPAYLSVYLPEEIGVHNTNVNASCAGRVVAINRNSSTYDDVLSILLTRSATNKKLNFYIYGCNWGYMEFRNVWFSTK